MEVDVALGSLRLEVGGDAAQPERLSAPFSHSAFCLGCLGVKRVQARERGGKKPREVGRRGTLTSDNTHAMFRG